MLARRILETLAMMIIGDCVLAIVSPSRHLALWLSGPHWWERSLEPLVRRPTLVRSLGLIGLIGGILLAWREEPPAPARARVHALRFHHNGNGWAHRLAEAMR